MPVTEDYHGGKFFVRNADGERRLYATPLLVVLLVIETTDVLFAVDSIPAILAITLNAFIVYTSNVFAILGLRSMYFAVSGLMKIFRFLHYGLAVVLVLVGSKMLASDYVRIPIAGDLQRAGRSAAGFDCGLGHVSGEGKIELIRSLKRTAHARP